MEKPEKDTKKIQVLQKEYKLEKASRKAAENSTWLHWYSFEINTDKSQGNESVLVSQLKEKLSFYSLIKNIQNR